MDCFYKLWSISIILQKPNDDEFDTTNAGPWMLKWPLKNENRHTKALGEIDRKFWNNMIVG